MKRKRVENDCNFYNSNYNVFYYGLFRLERLKQMYLKLNI